jgi:hypothetical protein
LALLVSLDHVGFSSSRVGQDENGLLLVLFLQLYRQVKLFAAMERTASAPDAKPGEEPVAIEVDELSIGGGAGAGAGAEEKKKSKVNSISTSPASTISKSVEELAEEQRTWHEERIRKRLQNEYERVGRALSGVVR